MTRVRRFRRSSPRMRALMGLAALLLAGGALYLFAAPRSAPADDDVNTPVGLSKNPRLVEQGRRLFLDGCSSCHGDDARGIPGLAPTLYDAGAAAASFYLKTGRMPLSNPKDEPTRGPNPDYSNDEINALVAYVGSLGNGPEVPVVDTNAGSLSEGLEAFTLHCAGCHQVGARGGIVTGGVAPSLNEATPQQIAEAIRIGPYLMPMFGEKTIDQQQVNSIARYVVSTRDPLDEGGWGIGHIGPIPEGMVAWLMAGSALLLVARLIGERNEV
jgi:ubiquinol-cytochrome c reductase cytochrome c subunit